MKRTSSLESISVFGGENSTFKPPKFTVILEGKQRGVFPAEEAKTVTQVYRIVYTYPV